MDFAPSNRNFHHRWAEFGPSMQMLPEGWKRDDDHLALREALIWEKHVPITQRHGVVPRADVFRPESRNDTPLPAILAWSSCGKTGSGMVRRPSSSTSVSAGQAKRS